MIALTLRHGFKPPLGQVHGQAAGSLQQIAVSLEPARTARARQVTLGNDTLPASQTEIIWENAFKEDFYTKA